MYDHRQSLSDEMVAALFQQHLPIEKIPAHVEKQLWRQVLVAVKELKHTSQRPAPDHADEASNALYQNSPPHAPAEKIYSVYPRPADQSAPQLSPWPIMK
jgi:hypothetical protein